MNLFMTIIITFFVKGMWKQILVSVQYVSIGSATKMKETIPYRRYSIFNVKLQNADIY